MRHVSLDLTLTDAEARNLLLVLETNVVFEDDVDDKNWGPLYDLADAIRAAMYRQPENILFVEHDSAEVLRTRQLCDFCDGTGTINGDQGPEMCQEC